MLISELRLRDFRLYKEAVFRPCGGITVLCGNNAQGKTCLLEAVQLCCVGRSHRTVRDAEFIRTGAQCAVIEAKAKRNDGSHTVKMEFRAGEGRKITVNGKECRRSGELMGHMLSVLFSPEDLRMVKDGPAERRRFVDMELSQLKPNYYYALQMYNRALTQRGNLLRDAAVCPSLTDQLDVWDERLAETGAHIAFERASFVKTLAGYAAEAYRDVSDGAEELSVIYKGPVSEAVTQDEIKAELTSLLRAARENDIRRGITTRGPHRDDIELRLGDMDVRAFGSQGQQRTAALAMKLSEMRVMRDIAGEWPVLMLDDVMSELDPNRRRCLLGHLPGVQTIVTCTDRDDLAGAEIGLLTEVSAGVLTGNAPEVPDEGNEIPDFLL